MMKLKIITGALVTLAMMSTAYAATCPTLTVNSESFKFTSARLQDKDSTNSVVICRYEGKGDLGASSGLRLEVPVKATGSNWKGDDCATNDGDASKCAFK
ncbi:hypothetical protein [Pseudomonas sp. McL0111]|uniref:hypothetical protein n=1 Tax=Pseudomonas sp. McL0111 TaxID=3457357 RepID=UPI00403E5F00